MQRRFVQLGLCVTGFVLVSMAQARDSIDVHLPLPPLSRVNLPAPQIHIEVAPPAPRRESVPNRRDGYEWRPGYWRWDGRRHAWQQGRWIDAQPEAVWVADHWERDGRYWRFVPGYWERSERGDARYRDEERDRDEDRRDEDYRRDRRHRHDDRDWRDDERDGRDEYSIDSRAWYSVRAQASNACIDAAGWGTHNGTRVQQWRCNSNSQANQEWQFRPTDSGYYKIMSRNAPNQVIDVSNIARENGSKLHLWTYVGGGNQQWRPVSLGNGYFKFVGRDSNRCIDVPGADGSNGLQLQIFDCNGTGAQAFKLSRR